MLKINGKTFMNIQEAVQWLLDNNALPFQSSANYVANTEIGMGTIVNPTPAKVRIGSLIFFADSKVSTVTGLTENGFIVSDQYNDLVDDIVYVSNVAINASGHLIVTLSNGDTIDAGLIKQVNSFSINGSQHLIVSYNDGTTTDLGAIFSGNVNIAGNFTADSIIENMSGYSAVVQTITDVTVENVFQGAVKNGNKLTFVCAVNLTKNDAVTGEKFLAQFNIPAGIKERLYPGFAYVLSIKKVDVFNVDNKAESHSMLSYFEKGGLGENLMRVWIRGFEDLTLGSKYYYRFEATFLLSDNLAS